MKTWPRKSEVKYLAEFPYFPNFPSTADDIPGGADEAGAAGRDGQCAGGFTSHLH